MSYEQKYKKYKQKYLNLKNEINELENNNKFYLTNTPLQKGGYAIGNGAKVTSMAGVPNASTCKGSVNPQPNVKVSPLPSTVNGAQNIKPQSPVAKPKVTNTKNLSENFETFTKEPNVTNNLNDNVNSELQDPNITNNKNLSAKVDSFTDDVTTTDLDNKYSDIEKMVSQLGGADVYDPFDSVTDDSISPSESSDLLSSEYNTVYSPIASDDLPGRPTGTAGKGHQMNATPSELADGYGSSPFS